ncbi:MAG: ATP phosphoribosyltransferase, partial [Clostridia bacterium]|nr:ATP phosphoribosyltransferase [Clostridia bacterium]
MLNIALPKGRLGDQVYALFSRIGCDCGALYGDDRRLVLESPENGVRYLLVKPSDVARYVEYGAADIG